MFYVYIIESMLDGRYYTGQTEKISERLDRHNKGKNISTKPYRPWKLKWWKEFDTRSEAFRTEQQIKALKKRERLEKFVVENNFRGVAQPG